MACKKKKITAGHKTRIKSKKATKRVHKVLKHFNPK
jgi:hypothetical protein